MSEETVANNNESTEKLLGGVTGKGFMPGQSGNPSGRPKKRLVDELLTELLEVSDSAEAMSVALKLIEKAKNGDVRAAQLIAERTQGKPNQKVEVTGKDGGALETSLLVTFVNSVVNNPDKPSGE